MKDKAKICFTSRKFFAKKLGQDAGWVRQHPYHHNKENYRLMQGVIIDRKRGPKKQKPNF